jgi:hypothetical protein
MATNFVEGYRGIVMAGTLDLNVQGWTGKIETKEVDITTTGDAGWEDAGATTKKFTFSFDGVWKKSAQPYSNLVGPPAGPALVPGSVVEGVKLYTDDDEFLEGDALILSVDHKVEATDVHKFTVSARNKGPWTLPDYTPPA